MKSEKGNTSIRISASKNWAFTLNNYTENDIIDILKTLGDKDNGSKNPIVLGNYIFQEEIGDIEGTPHLQGAISFFKKCRPFELFSNKKIHWEKCKAGWHKNVAYCSKFNGDGRSWSRGVPKKVKTITKLRP
jgi:hypothetical protein